jgi:hypothetical protein
VQELASIVETLVSMDRAGVLDPDAALDIACSMLVKSSGESIDYTEKVTGMLEGAVGEGTLKWSGASGGDTVAKLRAEEEAAIEAYNRHGSSAHRDRIYAIREKIERARDGRGASVENLSASIGRALAGEARAASRGGKGTLPK